MVESLNLIAGRYALYGELASGGMATVHVGRQLGAGGFARTVAIKRLHDRFAKDPEFVGMFLDEARLVARVRHPNVVQTLDVVATEAELFLVMDYVHGESLLRLLRQAEKAGTPVPLPVANAIMVGLLHGLHAAHEARTETGEPLGIVHRDVSPHNVLVGLDGVPRVLDFGIAKAQERVHSTRDGDIKGKLSYMTSEQIQGQSVDRRADIYAAAIVYWEMLIGQKLFDGETQAATMHAAMYRRAPAPSSLRADVSPLLDAVVMRGLARPLPERWTTAIEMAAAIERLGHLATPSELTAWVEALARDALAGRAAVIASIESSSSSGPVSQADVARAVIGRQFGALSHPVSIPAVISGSQPLPPPPLVPALTAPPSGPSLGRDTGAGYSQTSVNKRSAAGPIVAVTGALAAIALVVGGLVAWKLRGGPRAPVAAATSAVMGSATVSVGSAAGAPSALASAGAGCPPDMIAVPGGKFFMGSDDDHPQEKPAHNVTLKPYCFDRLEVTAGAYRACSDRGECKRAGQTNKWEDITAADQKTYDPLCTIADPEKSSHPINCVDWEMADRFCRASGKRLPTEAEWEFAARGPDGRKYPWGDAPPTATLLNACGAECLGWAKKNKVEIAAMYKEHDGFPTTAPVGSFPAGKSRYGAEDVVGNVWEWTADWYAPYPKEDQVDPTGPASAQQRAIRGGAWNGSYADWVRPTFRFPSVPEARTHGIGFRCAK